MSRPSLKQIRSAANILFKTDVGIKSRDYNIKTPRQIAHYVAHKIFNYSQRETGEEIGLKNAATVFHSCKKVGNEIPIYPEIERDVRKLHAMCVQKDELDSNHDILTSLIKSKTVDIHVKIELNRILKNMRNEGL